MRQRTPSLAARLRAAWTASAAQAEPEAPADSPPVEDFATRLRAAVQARRH